VEYQSPAIETRDRVDEAVQGFGFIGSLVKTTPTWRSTPPPGEGE
jgi:hypothetical protein